MSDIHLYDLVHSLFLNSMGESGTESRVLSLIKKNSDKPDKDIIEMSGVSKGTFYKYKKILQNKGLIRHFSSQQGQRVQKLATV